MKRKIAITGIIISTILILVYVSLRSGMIEEEYVKILLAQNEKIAVNLSAFDKSKPLHEKNLSSFLDSTRNRYPFMALFALTDPNGRLLISGKNDLYLEKEQYDQVIQKFSAGEFKPYPKSPYLIRYFNQVKYYLFVRELPEGKMLIVFPYTLRGKLLIKLMLELFLLLVLAVIFTTAVYLYLRRTGRITETGPVRIIEAGKPEPPKAPVPVTVPDATSVQAEELLRAKTVELFGYISSRYKTSSVSLYTMREGTDVLSKMYEMKGETFLKIESPAFDRLDIASDIKEELSRSSTMVLERGKRIVIPVLHRGILLATVALNRESLITGNEIDDIARYTRDLAVPLSAYLFLEEMAADRVTGLFSETYLQLKHDMLMEESRKGGKGFAIVAVMPFYPGSLPDDTHVNSVLKAVSREIKPYLPGGAQAARYGDNIIIILAETSSAQAGELKRKLERRLTRMKVKVAFNTYIEIQPSIGVSSSDTSHGDPDLITGSLRDRA